MRNETVIRGRRDSLQNKFTAYKYLSQEVAEARRAGWLQALNWVLVESDP